MDELFDRASLKRQRDRCASVFFERAELALRTEQELIERLSIITLDPSRVLVLGAISGGGLRQLAERFPKAQFTMADCSELLMATVRKSLDLSLKERVDWTVLTDWSLDGIQPGIDLVVSSLYLPLCDDFGPVFAQLHRVMRAGGCLQLATLGPDAFRELRVAWSEADAVSAYHAVEPPDMHDIGDGLVHAGFLEPVMERDNYTLTYSSVNTLMADLRNHGVGNGFRERQRGLTGRASWRRFVGALERQRGPDAIHLTVEIVLGQAWRSEGLGQQRRADGAVEISLQSLAASLEKGRNDVS